MSNLSSPWKTGLAACTSANELSGYSAQKETIKLAINANRAKNSAAQELYALDPTRCPVCFSALSFEARNSKTYCSSSCSAKATNVGRVRSEASKLKTSITLRAKSTESGLGGHRHCEQCSTEFYSTKRRFCSWPCYEAHTSANRVGPVQAVVQWRQRKKELAVELFGGKCELCGYSRCLRALHFHHKDPAEKEFAFGGKSVSWQRLLVELEKCALLCANCHSEVHAGLVSLSRD